MSDIIVYADEIVDIQDDVHYTEMYNELSKYKTLSHSEIDWHKVYTNSLDLLKKSLDTRVFRGFILGVISINTNDVFIKLNEVINHFMHYGLMYIKSMLKKIVNRQKFRINFLQIRLMS